MAKKRRVKRTTARRVPVARSFRSLAVKSKRLLPEKRRVSIVLKNLVFFILLFVVSVIFYSFSTKPITENLFLIISILLGFVSVALLIVLLILLFMRAIRK